MPWQDLRWNNGSEPLFCAPQMVYSIFICFNWKSGFAVFLGVLTVTSYYSLKMTHVIPFLRLGTFRKSRFTVSPPFALFSGCMWLLDWKELIDLTSYLKGSQSYLLIVRFDKAEVHSFFFRSRFSHCSWLRSRVISPRLFAGCLLCIRWCLIKLLHDFHTMRTSPSSSLPEWSPYSSRRIYVR